MALALDNGLWNLQCEILIHFLSHRAYTLLSCDGIHLHFLILLISYISCGISLDLSEMVYRFEMRVETHP